MAIKRCGESGPIRPCEHDTAAHIDQSTASRDDYERIGHDRDLPPRFSDERQGENHPAP